MAEFRLPKNSRITKGTTHPAEQGKRLVHIPLASLSPVTLRKIRAVHILAGRAATFDGDTDVSFGNVGAFDRSDPFSVAVWLRGRGSLPMAALQKLESKDRRRGYEPRTDGSPCPERGDALSQQRRDR